MCNVRMNELVKKLPQYETSVGNILPIGKTIRNSFQICIQNTTIDECRAYAQLLEAHGFSKYSLKEISVGTQNSDGTNLFYTYITEEVQVFLSWYTLLKTARIVLEPRKMLPRLEKLVLSKNDNIIPCLIQPKLNRGMSFVVQLADASFIVIDGGCYDCEDAQRLYEILLSRTPAGTRTQIAMWLFTHPHFDHIELATEFILQNAVNIDIKAFAYQFPDCKQMSTIEVNQEVDKLIKDLEISIYEGYPEANIYTLHTGQTYYFKGLEIEILFTGEDFYPLQATSYNDTSAAWRMRFDSGKKVLFLGDCMCKSCQQLALTYGEYLKSDILQVTHHGLLGGDKELYQLIDPTVCFWATSEERFWGRYPNEKFHWCIGEGGSDYNVWIRDPNIRERVHYHHSVTTTIEMT